MADVPVGAVPAATTTTPAAAAGSPPAVVRRTPAAAAARADKLAAVNAGLAKLDAAAPAALQARPAAPAPAPDDKKPVEPVPAPEAKKIDPAPAPDDKAAPGTGEEPPDEKTARSLALIDRRAKALRDEQATERAKLELDRAELARLRSDIEGRGSSVDDLKKLAKRDPIAALAKLGIESEDDWETVGRGAYPRTKAGKADPRAAPAVAQTTRERELAEQLAELKTRQEALDTQLKTRDAEAQTRAFVENYLDQAVKAIPTAPSLIGKLHEKSPVKARQALHQLGARMEADAMKADGATKYDPSYTPSHAEVIAEYEKTRRAELEEQGVDVAAMLAPPKPATPEPKKPAATLDPSATRHIRPANGTPSRAEKLAAVNAGLKKLEAEQA